MNKNFKSKLVAGLMTTAMIFSSAAAFAPVHAEDTTQNNSSVLKFNEYLVTSGDLTKAPNVSFNFTLTVPTTTTSTGNLTVNQGEHLESVKMNGETGNSTTVSFKNDDLKTGGDDKVHKTDDQKFAAKEVAIDFSGVKWSDPGIYRYNITQSVQGNFAESFPVENNDKTKAIDVYVIRNDSSNELVVNAIVMHSDETAGYRKEDNGIIAVVPTDDQTTDVKVGRFQNTYNSKVLGFDKKISGNQRSEKDEFKFTIKVENLIPGTTYNYKVKPTSANTDVTPVTIETGDTETSKEITISLYDGGSFELYGLNLHAKYTVTETDSKGYTLNMGAWADGNTIDNSGKLSGNAVSDGDLTGDARFGLINTKNGTVPTGIIFAVAPFAVGAVVLAAFIIVKMRRTAKQ